MTTNSAPFVFGNTYQRLPNDVAPLDRTGRFRKVHDWVLFVDFPPGGDALVEKVTFDLGDSIKIRGRGGTVQEFEYDIVTFEHSLRGAFTEERTLAPFRMLKLRDDVNFGIELELTSPTHWTLADIASRVSQGRGVGPVDVIDNYQQGRFTSSNWKLVPDSSIVCNRSEPDCNTFELVSPVLQGGNGLQQVNAIVKSLTSQSSSSSQHSIKVNKSMGFHVHIDVSRYTHEELVKICQNFIKYEDVMDSFMPPSRRTGSDESDLFFQSNRHEALARTTDVYQLAGLLNAENARYYKLNLQNLATKRQPTIEFRQHSATVNYAKIAAWVRFCVAFCANSARLAPPTPFASGRSLEVQTEALFNYVIKDRALCEFFRQRQAELKNSPEENACCSGCANGGGCSRRIAFDGVRRKKQRN
eukprot:scaffold6611_cov150-Amphora_coffeaeformis.AAC.6